MPIEITEAELAIMEVLWRLSPMRGREIADEVSVSREWHRKTVNTLIRRLVDKGAVGFEKGTGGFRYFPIVARDAYRHGEAKKLVSRLFDGEIAPLLAGFAETETLSTDDLKQLKKLVAKLAKSSC